MAHEPMSHGTQQAARYPGWLLRHRLRSNGVQQLALSKVQRQMTTNGQLHRAAPPSPSWGLQGRPTTKRPDIPGSAESPHASSRYAALPLLLLDSRS